MYKRRLVHEENHEGYHGHYNMDSTPLVSSEDLENISVPEGSMKVIAKSVDASRRSEMTIVSDRDFVSAETDEGDFCGILKYAC